MEHECGFELIFLRQGDLVIAFIKVDSEEELRRRWNLLDEFFWGLHGIRIPF